MPTTYSVQSQLSQLILIATLGGEHYSVPFYGRGNQSAECVGVSGKAVNAQVCAPGSRRISGKITASLCTCCAMLSKVFPRSVPCFLAFKMTSRFLKGLQLPQQRQLTPPCSEGGEMIPGGDWPQRARCLNWVFMEA